MPGAFPHDRVRSARVISGRPFAIAIAAIVLSSANSGAQGAGGAARQVQPKFTPPDTLSSVAGVVTDPSGHPLDSIEVFVTTSGQTVRTDSAGRYRLGNLLSGPTRLRARRVGWKPVDTAFVLARNSSATLNFVLSGRVSALDTIRIRSSQDDCAPRNFYGFACRRRAGIGVFRDSADLAAIKPDYWADMFDGMPGLRRDGHDVLAVTHWRCLVYLVNGRPPMVYDMVMKERPMYVNDVKAIEFYADANDAPKWYKVYTWPRGSSVPCSLIVYWTR
jgi:hypothetical protein